MKKGVRRILTCLLTLLLMLPPDITALAVSAGSNPTSDGGKIPASQFNIHARGYIVTLRLVPNTVADGSEEAESIEKSGEEWNGTGPVYTEAGYSTISQYYGAFPSFFTSSTIRATSALIALCDSNNKMTEFNSKDNYFIDGSGTRSKAWNRVANGDAGIQQHAVRNEAYSRGDYYPKLLGSKILADSDAFTAWQSGYKALEQYNKDYGYKKWRDANSSLIAAEAEKFLNVFKDAENLGKNLNDMLITGSDLKDENKRWENTLRYLDILMVIDYLTGNTCHSVVKSYYENRNANGSSSFATVFIASVASHSGNEFWDWYTLPTYYAMATGRACDKYTGICIEGNDVGTGGDLKMGSQTSEANALQQKIDGLFKQYKAVCPDILGSAYQYKMNWTNSSLIWWSKNQANVTGFDNWKMATMLMPTNVYGKMYGNAGYTYFSDAFVPKPVEKEIPGTTTLSCVEPENNWQKVVKGGSVDNVIQLSLGSEEIYNVRASETYLKQKSVLTSDTTKSYEIVITLTADVISGQCKNDDFFDTVDLGKGAYKADDRVKIEKSSDRKTCTITYANQTPADWVSRWNKILKPQSKQYITITDRIESVEKFNLKIRYVADVSINVKAKQSKDDLSNHFTASGKLILDKNTNKDATLNLIKHSSKAATVIGTALELTPPITDTPDPPITDTPDPPVTGTPPTPMPSVTPTPMPTTAAGEEIMNDCFYTSIKTPVYAEMKEGTPGHETFEAMAGVPTTEDLYVGFGGSEFMLSFDGEERITKSNDNREYNLTYTCNKCGETDEPCHISCPGHTFTAAGGHMTCTSHSGKYHSHSYCSEGSITVYCSGGPQSGTVSCSCGKNVVSWEVTPVYGTGYSECTSGRDGHNCQDGLGCVHTKKVNTCHTHVHTFTGKVTQPIDKFKYFDIKALWLWQLTQCKVTGLSSFMDINELTIDPKTGYQVFCSQEDYKNNNGRLVFSFIYADKKAERFSNTSNEEKNNEVMLHTECDQAATDWMNEQIDGITTKATVISDYAVLTTTQGYQSAMYHEYDSDEVVVTDNRFTTGQDNKSIAGNKITFSEPFPTWDDLWKANGKSAHDWSDHTIVASGYNGDYSNYSTKWNHGTLFKYVDENPAEALLTDQPNMAYKKGSTSFVQAGFTNTRLTRSGLNIRDANSTVPNGAYSAEEATATYKKVVDFNSPEYGIDWAADEATTYKEIDGGSFTEVVGYSPEHEDINGIVVHTPVSSQYAVVISNDKQYDCRTDASLAEGGDPPSALDGKCPMNESCSHAVLVCDNHGELHNESCYSMVQTGTNHVGGLNKHVCDKWCQSVHTHDSSCYSSTTCSSCGGSGNMSSYGHNWTLDYWNYWTHECGGQAYSYGYSCSRCSESYGGGYCMSCGSGGSSLGSCSSGCGYNYWTCSTCNGTGKITKPEKTCGLYDAAEMKCTQCNGTGSMTTPGSSAVVTTDSSSGTSGTCGSCGAAVGWYSYTVKCMRCGATASGGGSSHYCGGSYVDSWTDSNGNTQWTGGSSAHINHIGGCDGNYPATTKTCTACNGTGKDPTKQNCSKILNTHQCTAACTAVMGPILTCCDPHHHAPNEPWDYNSAKSHYPFGDLRCYEPCGDDEKHKDVVEVKLDDNKVASLTDIFVNVDREMYIYFPDIGDFAQAPTLHGIGTISNVRGMGYTNQMDTTKYTRNKFVTLPMHVIWYADDSTSQSFAAGEMIDLSTLTYDATRGAGYYKFYVPLAASEVANGVVDFNAIAVNAMENQHYYNENPYSTNRDRANDYTAKHTAFKTMCVDVVGTIGSLAINDTGDFRFSTLFKHALPTETNGWLIDGIIPNVSLSAPNKVVADIFNARRDIASAVTQWHDTWGTLYKESGGKAHQTLKLPLSIEDANLPAVENQQLKPGYKIYMDVETVGNYYGENVNTDGDFQDTKLLYKLQITPRYWELNLDTGVYTPVDVYMQSNNQYVLISDFDDAVRKPTDWYYYVDWTEEARRRNFFDKEEDIAVTMQTDWVPTRNPIGKDVIGTASRLFLNDLNRTFIGSEFTYGVDRNPNKKFHSLSYARQAQRWHFTLGLPSSTVFVYSGQQPVTENIDAMKSHNAVIVCAINIMVKGNVWTLEYDGTGINQSSNLVVNKDGRTYGVPTDPATGKPLTDPIIMVYDNRTTAKDDLTSQGSH